MYKVSVIIPVYNGERYLRECLDSVCRQSLQDIEIICVDDGSTDSSCEIIREYMEKDSRMSLYQQENQYCGIARNNGLEHADGEYVAFWDCDDTFLPDALECMYRRVKEVDADICLCRAYVFDEAHNVKAVKKRDVDFKKMPEGEWFNRESNEDYILNCTNVAVWNKLYRKAFLDRVPLRFTSHRHYEDVPFNMVAMCSADRITAVDRTLINYRVFNGNNESYKMDSKNKMLLPEVYTMTVRRLKELGIFPERSFVNAFLPNLANEIRKYRSIANQLELIGYLQKNCLEELCIRPREPGFYYYKDVEDIASHLLSDSPEDFLGFLNYETYVKFIVQRYKLNAKNEECKQQKKELHKIKHSRSYKLAKRIAAFINKIKGIMGRK